MINRASIFYPQLPGHGIGLTLAWLTVKTRTDPFTPGCNMKELVHKNPARSAVAEGVMVTVVLAAVATIASWERSPGQPMTQ
jgi:hypothetical protein